MTDNQIEKINERLIKVRRKLNLTQKEFADKVEYKQGYISELEKGNKNISKAMIYTLGDILSVNRHWLETGEGQMFNNVANNLHIVENSKQPYDLSDIAKRQGYEIGLKETQGIPMYNLPGSASNVEMYSDPHDVKVIGHLHIPGATKNSFALPVHGHSMYPTLANGSWGVVRPIEDRQDIDWGQIYYIEYGDYKVWKRLIKDDDNGENVILFSDNVTEMVNGKPKYASKTIRADRITKLCLLTDILQKPNY